MQWSRVVGAAAAVLAALAAAAPAARAAEESVPVIVPAKPQTASLDSEAPPGAPPHWLPGEQWVMQHWIPYDETRLYGLLGVTRGDVWRALRDDTHSLAELVRAQGWEPRALAKALVAPWRGTLREPHRLAVLEERALRTLTQGHLAQHLFFHSLHQNAIPDNAPAIFGTSTREEFQALRRSELSPLQICTLKGYSRAHARSEAVATLREMAERGVEGQAIPAVQAQRLLRRQLRQLPRWLRQTRYNGPPPLRTPRASIATAASFSNNPALAADGGRVVWEAYQAQLALAKRRGEIGVQAARPALGAAPLQVQLPLAMSPAGAPHSDYNPALSADGRYVAFESAQGNLNFAKRYGRMAVFVSDLETGVSAPAGGSDERVGGALVRSAYNPTISGDGRLVAFEAAGTGPGGLGVVVRDRLTGRSQRIASPPGAGELSEPDLAPGGRALAFTALGRFGGTASSRVWVRDLASGAVRPASPARAEAYEADLSRDGRRVAMTVRSGPATTRIVVRDLRTGRERVVAPVAGDGLPDGASASEPSVSHDGRRVAFVARNVGDSDARVFVRDFAAGTTRLVSRASGPAGAPADGASEHPAISGDGRRVAFASDAWNLSPAKCNSARGVFVRDLRRSTTTLVSRGDGDGRRAGPTRGSGTGAEALVSMLCA